SMMKNISSATSTMDGLGDSAFSTEKDIKEAIANSKKYFNELKSKVKENEKELRLLEDAFNDAAPGQSKVAAHKAFDQQRKKVEQLREALKGAEVDIKDLTGQLDQFAQRKDSWENFSTGLNQSIELVQKGIASLNFAAEIKELETNVQRMTGLTGSALD